MAASRFPSRVAALMFGLLALGCATTPDPVEAPAAPKRRIGRMDVSRAFYYPHFAAADAQETLATWRGGSIDAELYGRYLAGRFGTRYLEDLAFDLALARECTALGLVKNAPLLARSEASRRFFESGRDQNLDADGTQQRRFLNESLRGMRVDALAARRRSEDPAALKALFERRFGVDGERVDIRHVLVSFRATERRLGDSGERPDDTTVAAAAAARAADLHGQLSSGKSFADLLAQSDDRGTRVQLRQPESVASAGSLPGYNYQRFGEAFAQSVRNLKVGEVSRPVRSSVGFHIVELVDRKVTVLDEVAAALRQELARGSAKPTEVSRLREELLAAYGFRPRAGDR